jgi:hypothetical protein
MRKAAYSKLEYLYAEKDNLENAIDRAKKSKRRVSDLYELAKENNLECLKWERWLT